MPIDPFALPLPVTSIPSWIVALGYAGFSRLTGLTELARIYRNVIDPGASESGAGDETLSTRRRLPNTHLSTTDTFVDRVLDSLNVRVDATELDLARVPASGSLLVAANHPRGALDGLVVASLLRRVRPDVRVVVNHLLARIPELHDCAFFVDPFGGPAAESRSLAGLRAAHLWLRRGGALVMFPSGEVAHRLENGVPVESQWDTTMGRLALQTGAQILPVALDGRNSAWFYGAGWLHQLLRTALLPRELLRARGEQVRIAIGQPRFPGPFDTALETTATGTSPTGTTAPGTTTLGRMAVRTRAGRTRAGRAIPARPNAAEWDSYCRQVTEATRASVQAMTVGGTSPACGAGASHVRKASASHAHEISDRLRAEVADLDPGACLVSSGALGVFCAAAAQIPQTLREIGRLRTVTYRAAGEGTSAECDLDRFDETYQHLFVWDAEAAAVVGAYRLGRTDRLVSASGVDALYTRTLFDFDERLLAELPPAIELGRSFVRAEYQRQHQPLALLWKGIGQFVRRHPQYRMLFGPVSVSARYRDASRGLLVSFLEQHRCDRRLAAFVRPRQPFVGPRPARSMTSVDVDALEQGISSLEPDGKGVPVLLRQYLRLGARAISFSIDLDFGGVLDALMMVDLAEVEPMLLSRYLGREPAAAYLARHRAVASVAA